MGISFVVLEQAKIWLHRSSIEERERVFKEVFESYYGDWDPNDATYMLDLLHERLSIAVPLIQRMGIPVVFDPACPECNSSCFYDSEADLYTCKHLACSWRGAFNDTQLEVLEFLE